MSDKDKQAEQADNESRRGIGDGGEVAGGFGPGSDNPALAETYEEEDGDISTADFLMAREGPEEERLRRQHAENYAAQQRALDPRVRRTESDQQGSWPDDGEQSPAEYMDAPHADSSYLGGDSAQGFGFNNVEFEGEVDAMTDRVGADAARNISPTGLGSPDTADPNADFYDRREYDHDEPPSDLDRIAPGMVYLPPDDKHKDKRQDDEK